MKLPSLQAKASRHFTFEDLCHCGDTWRAARVENIPQEHATYEAIARLCVEILDPVFEAFGGIELTYGFGGPALVRKIGRRIAPKLDQHAGHERNARGDLICPRLGQAADLTVLGVSSRDVARFIAETTPFDRLYFYGDERPLHVSCGPEERRSLVRVHTVADRRIPQVISLKAL
jgi:hypothetical protein